MSQRRQASSYRPADVLAAFSRASAEAEQMTLAERGRFVAEPPQALSARAQVWIRRIRAEIDRGRRSIKGSFNPQPGSYTDVTRIRAISSAREALAKPDASSTGPLPRPSVARLMSHFVIPGGEDGDAKA